jgi:hypothetical protein
MSDDETREEVLGFAMMLRALSVGAAAFEYVAAHDAGFLDRSFESCALVFALPDESSESGLGVLPIKRKARAGIEQDKEVVPCTTREAAVALLKKFGDAKLHAEFADYISGLVN